MRIYLAGPMRGYALYNFPAFHAAASVLREAGFEVVSPAEKDLDDGFDPAKTIQEQGFDLKAALRWDLTQVLDVDAVVYLPGSDESFGAQAEIATARAAGIPVYDYEELVEGLTGPMIVPEWSAFAEACRNLGAAVAAVLVPAIARVAEVTSSFLNRIVGKAHPAEVECVPGAHEDLVGACQFCRACV